MPILTEKERLGTLIAGRYRLDSVLGRGGTAIVFDATHTWTGRRVALKLLRPEYAQDLALVRRFMLEARTAASLAHPNIVEVLDMGADEGDGTVFLVLELLEGETLSALLSRAGRLSGDEALALLTPVMRALTAAHTQGVVHRDVKPDNVFLARDAEGVVTAKLLDFGMAKMLEAAWGHATQSGTLIGTPFYMSPEQAKGAPDVGVQSDVWSMGVLLYRAVTGVLPFTGTTPTALLLAIVGDPPASVASLAPELSPQIARAIDRAIVVDRDLRHHDMAAFVEALTGKELPAPLAAREVSAAGGVRTSGHAGPGGPPWRAIGIGAVALGAAAALAVALAPATNAGAPQAAIVAPAEVRPAPAAPSPRVNDARLPTVVEAPVARLADGDAGLSAVPRTDPAAHAGVANHGRPRGTPAEVHPDPAHPDLAPVPSAAPSGLPRVTDVW